MPNRSKTINTKTIIICVNSLICDFFYFFAGKDNKKQNKTKLKTCIIAKNKLHLL